jgi:hypothetical protein
MFFVSNSGILLAFPCDSLNFVKGKPIERLGRKVTDLNPAAGHGGRAAGITHQTSFERPCIVLALGKILEVFACFFES